MVFTLHDKDEELYWPHKICNLNSNEIKALKHFYSELFNISKKSVLVCIYILIFVVFII